MNRKNINQGLTAVAVSMLLAGCVTNNYPAGSASRTSVPRPPEPVRTYTYPARGQDAAREDRDRYECFNWATRETGFDPSQARPPRQVRTAAPPAPGSTVLAGAATGALIGAVVSDNAGKGAIVGAAAGGILGAAIEQAQGTPANGSESAADRIAVSRNPSSYDRQYAEHHRAMSACMAARGYVVK